MTYQHFAVLRRGSVTVIAVAKASLAAVTEFSTPSPVLRALCEEFGRAMAPAGGVVLDMRDTDFLDHASVSAICQLVRPLADLAKPRAICCSPEVKQVLEICRIGALCPVVTTLDEAVARAGLGAQAVAEPGAAADGPRL